MRTTIAATCLAVLSFSHSARAQSPAPAPAVQRAKVPAWGVHGALGTDITLGIGFGGGVSYLLPSTASYSVELGGQLFLSRTSESTDEAIHTYDETTSLILLAFRGNLLFGYAPTEAATYYSVGGGLAAMSVSWEESSPTDTSLGTPEPDGGSSQSEDGTTVGSVLSAGIGRTFGTGLDIRLELPLIVLFGGVGEAAAVIPTLTASAGYRF